MKKQTILLPLAALLGLTLFGGAVAGFNLPWIQEEEGLLPAQPSEAAGVDGVLFARPYVLGESYRHGWRAEAPRTASGYLLVLEVDDAFTVPRDTLESVLYVGGETAERINWGTGSGRVVALVPAPLGADGAPSLDLAEALIFYGEPELPERVDGERIADELARAAAQGVPLQRVAAALEAGGELAHFADRTALVRYAATLVLEHSPAEGDLARGLLAPLLR
ncbi:MAG: hypothetical protein CL933_00980 [Deltaproteobacteria bacterium]|nr:hypothetical protein [Deltaproteobacteria bacterium]